GEMADGDRRPLRQQDRDPIPARNAVRGERIGEPVRALPQRTIGDRLDRPVAADVEDRGPVGVTFGPTVADVDRGVVTGRNLPAKRTIKRVVLALGGKNVGGVHVGQASKSRRPRSSARTRGGTARRRPTKNRANRRGQPFPLPPFYLSRSSHGASPG